MSLRSYDAEHKNIQGRGQDVCLTDAQAGLSCLRTHALSPNMFRQQIQILGTCCTSKQFNQVGEGWSNLVIVNL